MLVFDDFLNLDKSTYDQNTQAMLSHINVGYGEDITILELAQTIAKVIEYKGKIALDPSKPDGTPRKWMSSKRLQDMGWRPSVHLEAGLKIAYEDFMRNA